MSAAHTREVWCPPCDVRSAEESADVQRYTKERGVWDADAEEVEKWNDSQARMMVILARRKRRRSLV